MERRLSRRGRPARRDGPAGGRDGDRLTRLTPRLALAESAIPPPESATIAGQTYETEEGRRERAAPPSDRSVCSGAGSDLHEGAVQAVVGRPSVVQDVAR